MEAWSPRYWASRELFTAQIFGPASIPARKFSLLCVNWVNLVFSLWDNTFSESTFMKI